MRNETKFGVYGKKEKKMIINNQPTFNPNFYNEGRELTPGIGFTVPYNGDRHKISLLHKYHIE